jgi:hypothetical protein
MRPRLSVYLAQMRAYIDNVSIHDVHCKMDRDSTRNGARAVRKCGVTQSAAAREWPFLLDRLRRPNWSQQCPTTSFSLELVPLLAVLVGADIRRALLSE